MDDMFDFDGNGRLDPDEIEIMNETLDFEDKYPSSTSYSNNINPNKSSGSSNSFLIKAGLFLGGFILVGCLFGFNQLVLGIYVFLVFYVSITMK